MIEIIDFDKLPAQKYKELSQNLKILTLTKIAKDY